MSTASLRWISIATSVALASIASLGLSACSTAGNDDADSEELVGAPENPGHEDDALTGSIAVGSTLTSTTGVNLRTGPSTSDTVLHVVPEGAKVTVVAADPKNGFYQVKHNGTTGWSYGQYYKLTAGPPAASPPPATGGGDDSTSSDARDGAIARAKSAVGFSYWWGHGRFKDGGPSGGNAGSCSGSCPSCSHSGQYGGDCSGMVAKAWDVPSSNSSLSTDEHPYATSSFVNDTSQWHTVSRGNVEKADALVYNSGGEGHIFLYSSGDGWGSMYAYECKGCSYGCVYNLRTASSAYHAIRHTGW